MPADLLVVTASNSFADSIRRTMEETKLYRVHVVNNKATAIVRADEAGISLAMIDLSLGEEWVQEIGKSLRTIRPGMNLIIICDDNQTPPAFDSLRPWVLVRKSFDMTDFMEALNRPQTDSVSHTTPLAWLSDETKAAQHLTRLTLESSAQAALITRNNAMWAYAGGLSQEAAKEVAHTVARNWDGQKGSDLLRFIRLESTKAEHMLYATRLGTDVMLALVFDAETPFSTIRSQAGQLVTGLGNNDRMGDSQKFTPPPVKQQPAAVEFDETDFTADDEGVQISDILKSVPSPNPEPGKPKKKEDGIQWPRKQDASRREKFDSNETRISMPLSNATVFSRDTSPLGNPVMSNDPSQDLDLSAQTEFHFDPMDVTAPARPKTRPETPIARPAGEMDVTRESPTTEAAKKLVVEPVSAGLYHLTYACLLIPRFSSHHLVGDISEALNEWLPNISVAFGWRLEFLAIRPEYLQWVANVQPNTSPAYLMRIMRIQTSEKLFSNFPQYKKENPSGDFWAPGYLIMGGTQPHPPQLVRDYIRQIRQRQGSEAPPRADKPGK